MDGIGAIIKWYGTQKVMNKKAIVEDVKSYLDAAEGYEIEAVGKLKTYIKGFNLKHGMSVVFKKSKKIKDVSQVHVIEYIDEKYRTRFYDGKQWNFYLR